MDVVLRVRCCDQKDQVDGLAVQRVKIHTILYDHGCQSGLAHRIAFTVGNRNSLTDSGGAFFLSRINLFAIAFLIIDLSAFYHQGYHLIQRLAFISRCAVQTDTALV